MHRISIDSQEVDIARKEILDEIDNFSKEVKNYYDTLDALLARPLMEGKFLDKAKEVADNVQETEEKIRMNLEELVTVIEGAVTLTEATEIKFANKFKNIAAHEHNENTMNIEQ